MGEKHQYLYLHSHHTEKVKNIEGWSETLQI